MLFTKHATTFILSVPFPSPWHISFYFLSYSHEFAVFQSISQEPSLHSTRVSCASQQTLLFSSPETTRSLVQPQTLHFSSLANERGAFSKKMFNLFSKLKFQQVN